MSTEAETKLSFEPRNPEELSLTFKILEGFLLTFDGGKNVTLAELATLQKRLNHHKISLRDLTLAGIAKGEASLETAQENERLKEQLQAAANEIERLRRPTWREKQHRKLQQWREEWAEAAQRTDHKTYWQEVKSTGPLLTLPFRAIGIASRNFLDGFVWPIYNALLRKSDFLAENFLLPFYGLIVAHTQCNGKPYLQSRQRRARQRRDHLHNKKDIVYSSIISALATAVYTAVGYFGYYCLSYVPNLVASKFKTHQVEDLKNAYGPDLVADVFSTKPDKSQLQKGIWLKIPPNDRIKHRPLLVLVEFKSKTSFPVIEPTGGSSVEPAERKEVSCYTGFITATRAITADGKAMTEASAAQNTIARDIVKEALKNAKPYCLEK